MMINQLRMIAQMARFQDTKWKNVNTLYLACSGGGKSQALKQNKQIPKAGARVVLWDPDEDHKAFRFTDKARYKAALIAGLRSRRGFRLAFTGDATIENFEWWCQLVWAALDGRCNTYVIIEELATVTDTVSKATRNFGEVLRRGRKYGARLHATTQRGTEIAKTAYTQCPIKWVGVQEGADIKRMAGLCSLTEAEVATLKPLHFWLKVAGTAPEYRKIGIVKG